MRVVPLTLFHVVLTEALGSPCREGPRGLSQKRKPVPRVKQHALHDRAAGTSTSGGDFRNSPLLRRRNTGTWAKSHHHLSDQ